MTIVVSTDNSVVSGQGRAELQLKDIFFGHAFAVHVELGVDPEALRQAKEKLFTRMKQLFTQPESNFVTIMQALQAPDSELAAVRKVFGQSRYDEHMSRLANEEGVSFYQTHEMSPSEYAAKSIARTIYDALKKRAQEVAVR